MTSMPTCTLRVASKYKKKLESDEGNTVYVYTERQVANRDRKKAEQLEKLKKGIKKLRSQVYKDLNSEDPKTRLTALAVGLIDHTYERVGNETSADEAGHFGVTGWQKNHVSLGKGSSTVTYVGKSGVKHTKKVTDPKLIKALKRAHSEAEGKESCLFETPDGKVGAKEVNAYLKPFDVTAKDIRGLHANQGVCERLKKFRAAGPKLPTSRKEKDKILKEEFKRAIEETAADVGHTPAILEKSYVTPAVKESFLHDGTVVTTFTKKASDPQPPPLEFANRAIRQLVDHLLGEDVSTETEDYVVIRLTFRRCGGLWEKMWHGDSFANELLKSVVTLWGQQPGRKKVVDRANA